MSGGIESILIAGITSPRRQRSGAKLLPRLARLVIGASLLFAVANAPGIPRRPQPVITERLTHLFRESFNEAYSLSVTNAELTVGGYTFEESWSGYALQRLGVVTPFTVPAVDSTGHTNVACDSGAIRFWFKPYWSSASLTNGTGPGTYARLAELVATSGDQSAVCWWLQLSPDGSSLSLIGQSDSGPVELLSSGIAWPANVYHHITLDYGPQGTALFIDGTLAAQGAGTPAIPPALAALVLGSTSTGTATPGGDFDEPLLLCLAADRSPSKLLLRAHRQQGGTRPNDARRGSCGGGASGSPALRRDGNCHGRLSKRPFALQPGRTP